MTLLQEATVWRGHQAEVLCLSSSTRGNIAASGDASGCIRVWDVERGRTTRAIPSLPTSHNNKGTNDEVKEVSSLTFMHDDDNILLVAHGRSLYRYDTRVSDGLNGPVMVTDPTHVLNAFTSEEINHVAINNRGDRAAVADDSGGVTIVDVASWKAEKKSLVVKHTNICTTVAFNAKNQYDLFSGGLDSSLVRWDLNRMRPIQVMGPVDLAPQLATLEASASDSSSTTAPMINPPMVHCTDTSLSGHTLAVGRGDGMISVIPLHGSRTPLSVSLMIEAHPTSVAQVCFATSRAALQNKRAQESVSTARFLFSAGNDRTIALWDTTVYANSTKIIKECMLRIPLRNKPNCLAACPGDDERVVLLGGDTSPNICSFVVSLTNS